MELIANNNHKFESATEFSFLEQVIEPSSKGIMLCALEGEILFWNQKARQMYLYTDVADEVNYLDLLPVEMRGNSVDEFLMSQSATCLKRVRKDSLIVNVKVNSYQRVNINGVAMFLVIEELIENSASESFTEHAKSLDYYAQEHSRLRAEVDDMVAAATHDLRSFALNLVGYSQLLSRKCSKNIQLDQSVGEYVETIEVTATQLSQCIEDLFSFATLTRGGFKRTLIDLNELVENIVGDYSALLEAENAYVDIGNLPTVWAGYSHMYRLFRNLLDNAIKYRSKEKPLAIQVGAKKGENNVWWFFVQDNGIGIDSKYHDRVFKIFNRLKEVEVSGSGVGLASCRKLVEKYNGEIKMQSNKESGTKMIFSLMNLIPPEK